MFLNLIQILCLIPSILTILLKVLCLLKMLCLLSSLILLQFSILYLMMGFILLTAFCALAWKKTGLYWLKYLGDSVLSYLSGLRIRKIFMLVLVILPLILVMGCRKLCVIPEKSDFPVVPVVQECHSLQTFQDLGIIDCDFVSCPLGVVCDYISRSCGHSISCDKSFYSYPVSLHCDNLSVLEALTIIARSVGLEIIPIMSGYCLGVPNDNDRVIVSGYVFGYDSKFLQSALVSSLTGCTVVVSSDGLAIISCSPSSVTRVKSALSSLTSSRKLYRLRLVCVDRWFDSDLLDGSISIDSNINLPLADWYWRSGLTGSFKLRFGGSVIKSNVISIHDYVVLDGEKLSVFRGSRVPVAKHHISDSGSNSVTGYDTLDIGDKLEITAMSQIDDSVIIDIMHDMSRVSGYVVDYPIRDSNTVTSKIRLPFGSVYCIGESSSIDYRWGFLRWAFGSKKSYLLLSITPCTSIGG